MSAFRISVAAAAAAAAAASAQTNQPMDILPLQPEANEPTDEEIAPTEIPQGPPSEFEISPLVPVDPEGFGLYVSDQGGIGLEAWRGSEKALVQRILAQLPRGLSSPTMRDLIRRLLLSQLFYWPWEHTWRSTCFLRCTKWILRLDRCS